MDQFSPPAVAAYDSADRATPSRCDAIPAAPSTASADRAAGGRGNRFDVPRLSSGKPAYVSPVWPEHWHLRPQAQAILRKADRWDFVFDLADGGVAGMIFGARTWIAANQQGQRVIRRLEKLREQAMIEHIGCTPLEALHRNDVGDGGAWDAHLDANQRMLCVGDALGQEFSRRCGTQFGSQAMNHARNAELVAAAGAGLD